MSKSSIQPRDRLVQWLRDAYAMEQQAESLLDTQAKRIEHFPELQQRIRQHLEETQGQMERLEQCLNAYDEKPSTAKDLSARTSAFLHGLGLSTMNDEVVKGMGLSYAFEHMEIAAYRNVILAAQAAGDAEVERVCTEILAEEEAMADWLAEHQQAVTRAFLARDASEDVEAKR